MKPQPHYQPGDKIGGRYQVHQVKMGGMGEVYLCLDLETIQPYALKTFQQRYLTNPKLRAAFENEVATWVALKKHPNIVRCFYMDFIDNQPFMFLEWIASDESRGTDLRSWLRRGPLDLRLALDFTVDICWGLIHAQEKQPGIVHRDLKPDNILVAQGRLAKIADFGLAKIVQAAELEITTVAEGETDGRQSLLDKGGIVGTPPYMAPEQWQGETLDARTDIYAVGCILYELLIGSWPFQATTLDSLRRQHLEEAIPKLADGQTLPSTLDALLARCLAKLREERFGSADELLQELSLLYQQQFTEAPRAITISGEFTAMDYNNRGLTYHNLQRYEEALKDFNQAIELDPTAPQPYTNRGSTYDKLRRYNQALTDHTRAVELDPFSALAYNNRGRTYTEMKRHDRALANLNRAIQLDPNAAEPYCNRGVNYTSLQRYAEALEDFDRAIQLHPTYASAYMNRGNLYSSKLQRQDKALADLNRAIQLDPNDAQAYTSRGNTYARLQRYNQALADFARAIELDSNDALAYYNRGLTYNRLQRYNQALSDFNQAIHLDPTLAQAFSNRGLSYASLRCYEEALADYTCAIKLDPTDAQTFSNRGTTYARLQRYDEALADYTCAIELDPSDAQAHSNRGSAYASLRRHDEALADFVRAIELDPTYAEVYYNRGTTYISLQRYDEALADFKRAIQLDPTYAAAYFNIGVLHYDHGALREALPYLEKAAKLGLPQGAQAAARVKRELVLTPANQIDPIRIAYEAFQRVSSLDEMRRVVAQFPFIADTLGIAQVIAQRASPHLKPALEQRLAWLRQIASEQKREEQNQ